MDRERSNLTEYLDHLRLIKKFSDHTIRAYRQDIQQFIEYFEEKKIQINKENVRDFISASYLKSRNKSTLSRKIYAIKSFYLYLVETGKLEKNPMDSITVPKIDKKMPEILTEREILSFLDRLPEDGFVGVRNKAVFEMLYATGLRVSELTHLKHEDVNIQECMLRVMGKGKKERLVPFHSQARDILIKYLHEVRVKFTEDSPFIFLNNRGTRLSERSVERILQSEYKKRMQSDKKVYPHLLRHSFATHLLQRGANLRIIQELLGHSNLTTTEKYTNLNYVDLLNIYREFHPRST
jgi:site-specific recombinase XerD